MRLSQNYRMSFRLQTLMGGIGLFLLMVAAGCETKGFLDPTEMGRFSTTPHLVPILKNLDTGLEEPDEEFTNAVDVRPSDLVRSKGDYVIGSNDLVQVSVADLVPGMPETYKTARVTESGYITLPMVGQIKASGLTESALEQSINQAYRDKNLILDARASVVTVEARNRTFSITGAISASGQYQILDTNFRLLDALVLAHDINSPTGIPYIYVVRQLEYDVKEDETGEGPGPAAPHAAPTTGPTPEILAPRSQAPAPPRSTKMMMQNAGAATSPTDGTEGRIVIINGQPMQVRNGQLVPVNPPATPPEPQGALPAPSEGPPSVATGPSSKEFEFNTPTEPTDVRTIRVPYDQLKRGELKYNIVIRPHDFIWVPQPTVGEYYMGGHVQRTGVYSLTARNITLKQAIVSAGMLDQLGIPRRTQIIRRVGTTKEIFARIDLDKVFSGDEPDIILKAEDVVMVGSTAYAPFLAAFRNGFRITYGFGFIYDRNFYNVAPK